MSEDKSKLVVNLKKTPIGGYVSGYYWYVYDENGEPVMHYDIILEDE